MGQIINSYRFGPVYNGPYTTTRTLLQHSFTVANTTTIPAGEVGPAGSELAGDWSVASNKLQAPGTGEAVYAWDIGQTSYSYQFTFSNLSVDPGPIVRCADSNNYILVQMNSSGTSSIYQRVGGGYTAITAASSIAWTNGDTVRVDVTSNSITVYRNGTQVLTVSSTQFNTQTKVGFRTNGGAVQFDDVLATTTSTQPRPTLRGSSSSGTGSLVLPTVSSGDLILLGCGQRSATLTIGGVSGFASLGAPNNQSSGNANQQYTHAYTKIADGTESGATVTLTGVSGSVVMMAAVVRPGYGGTLSVELSPQIGSAVNTTSTTMPTVNTAAVDDLVLYLATHRNSATASTFTISSGPTLLQNPQATNDGAETGVLAVEVSGPPEPTRTLTAGVTGGIGGWTIAVKEV